MHTYRNEQHGFNMELPEEWSYHSSGKDGSLIFKCRSNEAFHIEVIHLPSEPSPGQAADQLKKDAEKKGYMSPEVGRITVGGKEHVWARYYLGGGLWSKKYLLIFNVTEYAITATYLDQKLLLEMEKDWDSVASSVCPTKHENTDGGGTTGQETIITVPASTETKNAQRQVPPTSKEGMKTYRNERLGFEIDVPVPWIVPQNEFIPTLAEAEVTFNCGGNEAFYIIIGKTDSKLSPEQVRFYLNQYAMLKGYSRLEFGRYPFAGHEFVWVRYYLENNIWIKKFILCLDHARYEITGSCTEQGGQSGNLNQRSGVWDAIVRSLRIIHAPAGIPPSSTPGWAGNQPMELPTHVNQNTEDTLLKGTKTYRNEKHGFEIDIPESWQPAPSIMEGLTKDKSHLNSYLYKKMDILREYYIIQDWYPA